MKRVVVLFAILLTACPGGKSASIEWSKQPHADIIPRPVAAWAVQPCVRTNFAQVHTYPGVTVPAWIQQPAAAVCDAALDAELAWSNSIGVPRARGNSGAIIEYYLYYNPAMAKGVAAVPGADCIVTREDGKATSAVADIPAASSRLSGITQIRTHGDTITRCTVWINVSYYEAARLRALREGKNEADARAWACVYMAQAIPLITWHEGGHSLYGLSDDIRGNVPGLMVYRNMTFSFSAAETAVIRWLYP
jgi:hypothetical protein